MSPGFSRLPTPRGWGHQFEPFVHGTRFHATADREPVLCLGAVNLGHIVRRFKGVFGCILGAFLLPEAVDVNVFQRFLRVI
jgi:hypothetical protein